MIYGIATLIAVAIPFIVKSFIVPVNVPFLMPIDTHPFFEIHSLHQTYLLAIAQIFIVALNYTYGIILQHITTEIDIILELCEKIGCYEEWLYDLEAYWEKWKTEVKLGRIKPTDKPKKPENCTKFETLLVVIVEMHSSVNQ